ncbi:Mth938-like domain-containing protein [Aspergillus lucknowensis]|uniref:Mth938 domain-containing protein n=1 Tax=Aspergillus lucknowensis TaxID=176173 RepID=A0ABR4LDH6_9EURO
MDRSSDNTPNPTEAASTTVSPMVTHVSWGRMEVEGIGTGKDFKLYPGGGRAWDWGEYGTRHEPGIQPGDVKELLDHGATVVVLSSGMEERLKTMPETLQTLADQGVEVHVAETKAAVEIYNKLIETKPVGGLFHSTC